eukprot:TRINITY_DN58559_c0_g1_i1.p1 TRINITY_DN58559_c0_g1~~TRINITY_DN58559_c0_g1_i1.p1  ORF type:complete len:211 (-),score=25.51 TRINITY_DN58559_c0_g1_i1:99-731(-)
MSETERKHARDETEIDWFPSGYVRCLRVADAFVFMGNGRFEDDRGLYEEINLPRSQQSVQQSGYSVSKCNVVRGLHCSPYGKIVACLAGEMWDVLVDFRPESETYLQWDAVTLSPSERTRVFVPPRVGHGYFARMDGTTTLYLKLGCFDITKEINVNAFDPELGISWPAPVHGATDYLLSNKDRNLPALREMRPRIEAILRDSGASKSRL